MSDHNPRFVTHVKPTKHGQRAWFRCAVCGDYGDASGTVEATEYVADRFTALHLESCYAVVASGEPDRDEP